MRRCAPRADPPLRRGRPPLPGPGPLRCGSPRRSPTLHVFLDESGGTDPANDRFLVAAVAIAPEDAARLVRGYRKAARASGEVKGTKLSPRERGLFLDLLVRAPGTAASAIVCRRADPVGGWAMGSLPEPQLYAHLLAEALAALPGSSAALHLATTADGGRYKRPVLDRARGLVTAALASHTRAGVTLDFGDSASSTGLQVADVIANTVFTADASLTEAPHDNFLAPLLEVGRLVIRPLRLDGIRPPWLAEA